MLNFPPRICLKFPNVPESQNVDSLNLSGNSDLLAGKVWIPQAVCAKCAKKIRNATDLMRFLRSAFNVAVQNPSSSIEYSPIEVE